MGLGFMEASGPIGIIVAALQALGFLQPIVNTIMGLVGILSIGLAPVLDVIIALIISLTPLFEGVSTVIEPLAQILSDALMPIILQLTPVFDALMQAIFALLMPFMPLIDMFLQLVFAIIPISPILDILTPLLLMLANAITYLMIPVQFVIGLLMQWGDVLINAFTNGFAFVSEFLSGFFTDISAWIVSGFDSIGTFFRELPKRAIEAITDGFDDAWDSLTDLNIGGRIKDTVTGWFT